MAHIPNFIMCNIYSHLQINFKLVGLPDMIVIFKIAFVLSFCFIKFDLKYVH